VFGFICAFRFANLAPTPTQSLMTPDQVDFVMPYTRGRGGLDYHDMIGLNVYKEIASTWGEQEQTVAQTNVGEFGRFMLGVLAEPIGYDGPGKDYEYGRPENFRKLVQFWARMRKEFAAEHDPSLIPVLEYQSVDNKDLGDRPISTFLHFGSESTLDSRLDAPIRMFVNPTPQQTPLVAMGLSAIFGDKFGRVPYGKFHEDSTARGPSTRRDRLVLWLNSPEELTTAVHAVKLVTSQRPNDFAGREPILLGRAVVIDGKELPTVRIAQDPSPSVYEKVGGPVSFNQLRVGFLKEIIKDIQDRGHAESPNLDQEIAETAQRMAPEWGINPDDIGFNRNQDLSVIDQAIAAA